MKTKTLFSIGKSLAIAILVLGVIHDVATFTMMKGGLDAVTYFSLICGTSLILCGIILLQLFEKVSEYSFLQPTILLIGTFLALNGILATICMLDNPFAWIALLLNLSMFVLILKLKLALK